MSEGSGIVRALGSFGRLIGAWSRSGHTLEVWKERRSAPETTFTECCAICGASGTAFVRLPTLGTSRDLMALGDYHVVLCTACDVARTAPLPSGSALAIAPDAPAPVMGMLATKLLDRFIAQRVQRVRPLLPTGRAPLVIDIGAGACAFANAMARTGCDVIAFEPNGANASRAASGVRFEARLFDASAVAAAGIRDGSADAVTMWHSLEHVPDPAATLALARRLLRQGGVLYVSVPNLDSLQADLAREWWCYLDIPHHVSHFTPRGLDRAVARAGFSRVTHQHWSEEYEIFGFFQSLLNVLTRSQNYYYNRAKKGRASDAGPYPAWTAYLSAVGPLLLPVALFGAWLGSAMAKPACVECSAHAGDVAASSLALGGTP